MTSALLPVDEIVARWSTWATQAANYAATLEQRGNHFDAGLKRARGNVRAAAAAVLRSTPDLHDAAAEMIRRAITHSVRTPPLIGYDQAALSYTRARTWQACARELNPEVPEVQPRWT